MSPKRHGASVIYELDTHKSFSDAASSFPPDAEYGITVTKVNTSQMSQTTDLTPIKVVERMEDPRPTQ